MNKVPKIISTKDLAYITDMLNWNFFISKKVYEFINVVNDNEVKKILQDANSVLISNYEKSLNLIK